jgi:hypothetical protein
MGALPAHGHFGYCIPRINEDFEIKFMRLIYCLFAHIPYLCIKQHPMTTKELRQEISRVIQEVPETVLEDILIYLKKVGSKSGEDVETMQNLRKILKEDETLLERLAK